MGVMPEGVPYRVRGVYDAKQDHCRGLTVAICQQKIQELDEKLACTGTAWGDDAKIRRWQESLEFFLRQLERFQRKRGW
jgi:hypothetical protein